MKAARILLLIVAVVCIAVAVSYPIRYQLALHSNNTELEELSAMRMRVREELGDVRDEGAPWPVDEVGENPPEPTPDTGATMPEPTGTEPSAAPIGMTGTEPTAAPIEPISTESTAAPIATTGTEPTAAPIGTAGAEPTAAPIGSTSTEPTAAPIGTAGTEPSAAPIETAGTEPTAAPIGTTGTEPTAAPIEPTGTEPTAAPIEPTGAEPTAVPVETTGAEPTAAPVETAVSEPTAVPVETPGAEPTAAPGATEVLSDTLAPMDTVTPEPTARPVFVMPEYHGPTEAPGVTPTPDPGIMELIVSDPPFKTPTPSPEPTPSPTPSPSPSPTPDRTIRTGAAAYTQKEKVALDESRILPELRDIYALNHDLVGWLFIDDTLIDYPVVQSQDSEYYLKHDFYGNNNANGQIILDTKCDPYTPSYNLVISGHHMNSGAMFGRLPRYKDKKYWETHKLIEFDTLMTRKQYVIFAVFYSADYDENEEGFRYNADIQYKVDAEQWLAEIRENQIYDTGIDVEFGDEFITLTTCDHGRRRDGRFVAVARRIREGEEFK